MESHEWDYEGSELCVDLESPDALIENSAGVTLKWKINEVAGLEILRLANRVRELETAAAPFAGGAPGWLPDGTPQGVEVHTVGVTRAEHEALVAALAECSEGAPRA